MSKSKSTISSICAVMALAGTVLIIGTHHTGPTDIWSIRSVHISVYILAVALMSCPFISWLRAD